MLQVVQLNHLYVSCNSSIPVYISISACDSAVLLLRVMQGAACQLGGMASVFHSVYTLCASRTSPWRTLQDCQQKLELLEDSRQLFCTWAPLLYTHSPLIFTYSCCGMFASCRALQDSRQKLEQLRESRKMAALVDNSNDGEGGGGASGKGSSKRKRGGKKGAAGDDMGDFYVDDAQPIERLPKARKDDADVQVRRRFMLMDATWCGRVWADTSLM
jgi:hypothetical protein